MWLKEEGNRLIPPPVNYQTADGWIMNFYKNPEQMTAHGWREYTREEFDAWYHEHPEPAPPEQTIYSKLAIRRAMRELGIEAKLDALLNASAQFRADWNDAQEIDLADPVLLSALESGTVTAEEIAQIKRVMNGANEANGSNE